MLDDSAPYLETLESENDFSWQLKGRIIVLDNGGLLPRRNDFNALMEIGSLACIVFDPTSDLRDRKDLFELEEFQLFSHVTLGNGETATLYACLAPEDSATLSPVPRVEIARTPQVLAQLPISTVELDSIEGLNSVDWLLLDERNDNLAILNAGHQTLRDTLLIQVRAPLQPLYEKQSTVVSLLERMRELDFELYTFCNHEFKSRFPAQLKLERSQATQLEKLDLLFIPSNRRLTGLTDSQRTKLSHILTVGYRINDLSYELIAQGAPQEALQYLLELKYLRNPAELNSTEEKHFTMTADYSPDIWEITF